MRKDGIQSGRQRYGCRLCNHRFQYKKRDGGVTRELWNEYTRGKQTMRELGAKYGGSHVWIRKQLDVYNNSNDSLPISGQGSATPTISKSMANSTLSFWNLLP